MSTEIGSPEITDLEFEFTGLGKTQKAVLNKSEEFQIYGLNKDTEIGENLFFMIEQIKQLKNMNIDLVDNKGNPIILPHEDASAIENIIKRIRSVDIPNKDEVKELDEIIPVIVEFFLNNPDYIYFDEGVVIKALEPIDKNIPENISKVSEETNEKSTKALSASEIRKSFVDDIDDKTRASLQDIPDSYRETKEAADTQRTKRMTSIDKTLESLLNILPQQEDATLHAEFDESHVSLTKDLLKTIEYINTVDKQEFEQRNPGLSYEETLKKVDTIQTQTRGIKKQVELNDNFNKGLQDQIDMKLGESTNVAKNIKELQQKLQAYANSASPLRMSVSIAQKTIDTIQLYYLELIYIYIQSYIDHVTYNNEAVPNISINTEKESTMKEAIEIPEAVKQESKTTKETKETDEGETMLHLKTPNIHGDHKSIQQYIEYFIYSVNIYMAQLSNVFPEARNSQIKSVNLEELAQKNINCFLIVTPYQESTDADLKILEETQKQSLAILEEAQANTSLVFKPVPKKVQPILKKEEKTDKEVTQEDNDDKDLIEGEIIEESQINESEETDNTNETDDIDYAEYTDETDQQENPGYNEDEPLIEGEIIEESLTEEQQKKAEQDRKNKELVQSMRGVN